MLILFNELKIWVILIFNFYLLTTVEIKFQYKIGGLEYSSKRKNDESIPILDRCGIREHVCDILEGGEKAFRDRENKYGFFKI